MASMNESFLKLILVFTPISLAAFGGAASIYAPLQHQSVDVHQWVSAREFLDLFAVSRATPGPGSMLGTLIGWKVAGLSGAIIATLAFYVPASTLVFFAGSVWNQHRGKTWQKLVETGLAPVGGGLLLAGSLTLTRTLADHLAPLIITLGVAALTTWMKKVHPFVFLVGGGAASYLIYAAGS